MPLTLVELEEKFKDIVTVFNEWDFIVKTGGKESISLHEILMLCSLAGVVFHINYSCDPDFDLI